MKTVLIISPYFVPSNAADMQRIRMSLPFFQDFEWQAEVVAVNQVHSEMVKDPLLEKVIPQDILIHYVSAFDKKITSKAGLGSLALRSLWFYKQKVNELLTLKKYDLIYFSTTQFPICTLGAYWKKKFGIPYVIDMQDPWHSTYYLNKPKSERPPKFWFSYRLNKYLEPIAMKNVDGIISVSEAYINDLKQRYKEIENVPSKVITFGFLEKDFTIAKDYDETIPSPFKKEPGLIYIVYIGRGGYDMQPSVKLLLLAFKELLSRNYSLAKQLRFRFLGTSYAPTGKGTATFSPIATELNISDYVEEDTNRISFYETIKALQSADALVIPGSNDPKYTASKIYPYVLAKKPLLALFNPLSSAYNIIKKCNAGHVVSLTDPEIDESIQAFLLQLLRDRERSPATNWQEFEQYSAKKMTEEQCSVFNLVVEK